MEGAVELAEEIFHMPVRVGAPQYAQGLRHHPQPDYATAVGLLLYGAEDSREGGQSRQGSDGDGVSFATRVKNGLPNTLKQLVFNGPQR